MEGARSAVKHRSVSGIAGLPVWLHAIVIALTLCAFLLADCSQISATARVPGQDPISDAEQSLFIKGQNLYSQGLYNEAIVTFGEFLKAYPQSQIKDLTLLWLGRSYLRLGDFARAEQTASRLREITDTAFVSIYDEELRVARHAELKSAGTRPRSTTPAKIERSNVASEVLPVPTATTTSRKTAAPSNTPNTKVSSPLASETPKQQPAAATLAQIATASKAATFGSGSPKSITAQGPMVRVQLEQSSRDAVINGASFYRLVVSNEGNGLAKEVVVSELLSEDWQFASSYPAPSRQEAVAHTQRLTFRIAELKPGESRTLRIAVRPRAGVQVANPLNSKHSVSCQDSQNKSYRSE